MTYFPKSAFRLLRRHCLIAEKTAHGIGNSRVSHHTRELIAPSNNWDN